MKIKKWEILTPKDFECTKDAYQIGGRKYYRVTQVLGVIAKHSLRTWMAKVGHKKVQKILTTRQALGTTVHKLIELHLSGEVFNLGSYEEEIRDDLTNFYQFEKDAKLKPDALEQRLWSNTLGYAGTADFIGRYTTPKFNLVRGHKAKFPNGGYVIGDWKTSKGFYPSYWLQLGAYIHAFEELTGIKPDGAVIVRLRDNHIKVREMTYDEIMFMFPAFLNALGLFEWQRRLGRYTGLKW